MTKEILHQYVNGNISTVLYTDGTLEREWEGEANPEFPSSMDVKITNYCEPTEDNPICAYCHEMSSPKGLHGDLGKLRDILCEKNGDGKIILKGTEIACLAGGTVVYGSFGAKDIKDLQIGDKIYDSNHELKEVIDIKKTNKKAINMKLSKSFNVTCSEDHPFMVNGKKVKAIDIKDSNIDTLTVSKYHDNNLPVIDFSKYVKKASYKKSSRGGDFNETSVRIANTSGWCDRFITIDEDIMWLYGIVVAEGSKKSIVLNSNENDIAERAIKIYKKVFDRDSNVFNKSNSQAVEFKSASIYRTFFFDALNINHGARNKSINYLFNINNIKLIRAALYGLFQGDGAFRVRENKNKKYFSLTYKTTSKKLAYEIVFLLKKHFDVSASLYHGVSPEREIEGRTLKSSDYYKIDIYNKEDLSNIFPDLYIDDKEFNLIGTHKYSNNGKNTNINIDKITQLDEEDLYDITLEDNSTHIFPINGYILTHNCGGGNPLSHPDLIPFLVALKNHGLVANMTINQKHIKPYAKLIERLIKDRLIVGVGISYSQSRYLVDIAPLFKLTDNIVFHVIMGVNNVNELSELNTFCKENNSKCKVLVLGYKQYGFGINYYVKNKTIEDNKYEWYTQVAKYFKDENITVSFDNKAIEQLKLRRFFTNEAWDRFFQSEDFVLSMYIDAVKQEYAPSSTSSNRVSFNDSSLLDYFQKNRNR